MMELKTINNKRMQAFNHMLMQKDKVAESYNKRVRKKSCKVGDLIWKLILPIEIKNRELGKWSPN